MQTQTLSGDCKQDAQRIRTLFGNADDLILKPLVINHFNAFGLYLDGLCDEERIIRAVTQPLTDPACFSSRAHTAKQILLTAYKGADVKTADTLSKTADGILAGNFIILLEGETNAFLFAAQGFPRMPVGQAQSEQNEFGGREGFNDTLKDNIALLRRKVNNPQLCIEQRTVGESCRAGVAVCYLAGKADAEMIVKVKKNLTAAKMDTLLGSGWLRPFLNGGNYSVFPATGITERPDVLAYKLSVGRIGILVDGSPFALIVPYLFTDYFHAPDDYVTGRVYAFFIRSLRLLCFLIALTLPAFFVAVCDFHPNMLPSEVMFKIASAEAQTPFPLALEAVAIHLIYEFVREAGLRMPKAAGHTVSIVGALVIGDAAVKAGLIAAPMLIVVAVTTVCSAVVSKLQDRLAVLRLLLIAAGALSGFFGIFLGLGLLTAEICSVSPYGVPLSAPLSPFEKRAFADGILRTGVSGSALQKPTAGDLKF